MNFFQSILHHSGSQTLIQMLSLSPWENSQPRRCLLALNCATLGKRWGGQSETLFLTLFNASSLGLFFFTPMMCWDFSTWLQTSTKAFTHGWLSKSVFFEGKMVENIYFAILFMSLLSVNSSLNIGWNAPVMLSGPGLFLVGSFF